MLYTDFRPDRPRHLTTINDQTYRATAPKVSPWHVVEGWTLGTAFWDIMHVLYLGTARDLIPSLLGDFAEKNMLGDPTRSLDEQLRTFSVEMNRVFKANGSLRLCLGLLL